MIKNELLTYKNELDKYIDNYYKFISYVNNLLKRDGFIYEEEVENVDKLIKLVNNEISLKFIYRLLLYRTNKIYHFKKQECLNIYKEFKNSIDKHNDDASIKEIKLANKLIDEIEGNCLDNNQLNAIVRPNNNELVLAAAGTGKTTTIIGKVKYLLSKGIVRPKDILLLSFTNKAATEMKSRLKNELNISMDVFTFHKLGLEIIKECADNNIKITDIILVNYIKRELNKLLKEPQYATSFVSFLLYNRVPYRNEFNFNTLSSYTKYVKINPFITIDNKEMANYSSMVIANFLFQNNIKYEYNVSYKFDKEKKLEYKPDFYLPDYDIYIEYYGINRKNEVPSYLKGYEGMDASTLYNKGIKWKRNIHKKYSLKVIETYSYEMKEGTILFNLSKNLDKYHAKRTIDSFKTLDLINKYQPTLISGVIELFETVINLLKCNNYTMKQARELNLINGLDVRSNDSILTLLEPILESYNDYLKTNNEIDFNDMINRATSYILNGNYINNYKYVIVDEFQDMSKSRYNLLCALRKSNFYKLFCVGDDFQSIYRFSGSDIGLITDFSKYFGKSYICKIENTYRFSNKLVEISNNFILKNPKQIKKDIFSNAKYGLSVIGFVNGSTDKAMLRCLEDKLNTMPKDSKVFFLGRYTNDIKVLDSDNSFTYNKDNITSNMNIEYSGNKNIKIEFLTIHKSKGLQADYVVILNNKKDGMGFPSNIQDLPIIYLLLDKCDDYPYSEERRLFYVALTRASKKVFMLVSDKNRSVFINELSKDYGKYIDDEKWECPLCGSKIIKKSGPYGDYYGCSSHEKTGCKYIRKYK